MTFGSHLPHRWATSCLMLQTHTYAYTAGVFLSLYKNSIVNQSEQIFLSSFHQMWKKAGVGCHRGPTHRPIYFGSWDRLQPPCNSELNKQKKIDGWIKMLLFKNKLNKFLYSRFLGKNVCFDDGLFYFWSNFYLYLQISMQGMRKLRFTEISCAL